MTSKSDGGNRGRRLEDKMLLFLRPLGAKAGTVVHRWLSPDHSVYRATLSIAEDNH